MPSLTALDATRLVELFEALRWSVREADGVESARLTLFRELLHELDAEEKELILTITADFYLHALDSYQASAARLADMVAVSLVDGHDFVVALPLQRPKDVGLPKSAGLALYLLRHELAERSRGATWRFCAWDRLNLLNQKAATRTNALILLVDDFIGSGTTARECVAAFRREHARPSDKVILCAFVALSRAAEALNAEGVDLIAANPLQRRGISDSTRLRDKVAALATMDNIELRLKLGADYRRGYKQSEALVYMARCPNNTFPVYWADTRKTGGVWPAPFRR